MTTTYEWDIETVCAESNDVLDHNHRDRLNEYPAEDLIHAINQDTEPGDTFTRLVLVADSGTRTWAYVDDGELPNQFEDGTRVPSAFRIELHPDRPRNPIAEKLRLARVEAAERFTAIAMKYVPPGYTVEYRKSLSGRCGPTRIIAPRPITRKALYIFLHECAHAHLHWPQRNKTRHVEEMEAEKWAHEKMRENGVAVPRVMTKRAKQYVRRKIRQALARGAKRIDPEARRFAR